MKIFVFLLVLGVVAAIPASPSKISPKLAEVLKTKSSADIVIRMTARADPVEMVSRLRFASNVERRAFVRNSLMDVAQESQKDVIAVLEQRNYIYESTWITNSLFVFNADRFTIESELSSRLDIDYIDVPALLPLPTFFDLKENVSRANGESAEWGVVKVDAPLVWGAGNKGEGVVVANIDTGVRWTHEALIGSYRGSAENNNGVASHDYNWYQPNTHTESPADTHGHGSHTMGTIAGSLGIGVAPAAKWIACQGCELNGCSEFSLTTCGQFLLCPTTTKGENADCSKAPHVINNSWGGGQGDDWYDSIIQSWVAAGIIPMFSMGNSGPNCGTANSPGDSPYTTAVGATDVSDSLAKFSSRGPAKNGDRIKPEIVAPGVNVRSAWYNADNAYSSISGTSMACPHATGVVALVLSADKKKTDSISALEMQKNLETTTDKSLPKPAQGLDTCGGTKFDSFPNYLYGYGRINACSAVEKVGGACAK